MSISVQKHSSNVSSLSPEYALLGFLAQQPAHGYDLHHRLQAELGQIWHIPQSQLYNLLKRLKKQDDIAASVEEQHGLPDRRIFHLTEQGRQRFEGWMETPSGNSVRAIRVEFLTRLYFAQQQNAEKVAQLIDAQMAETRRGMSQLERKLDNLPREQIFNRLGLELKVRQLASVLEWLEECRIRLGEA